MSAFSTHARKIAGFVLAAVLVGVSTFIVNKTTNLLDWLFGSDEPPSLTAVASEDFRDGCADFVTNRPLRAVPKKPTDRNRISKFRDSLKAYDDTVTSFSVTIQAQTNRSIILQRMDLVSDSRSTVSNKKWRVLHFQDCGSGLAPARFTASLDRPNPQFVAKRAQEGDEQVGALRKFPFKVRNSDPEVFDFDVIKTRGAERWHLILTYVEDGQAKSLAIRNENGRSFATAGDEGLEQVYFSKGRWQGF